MLKSCSLMHLSKNNQIPPMAHFSPRKVEVFTFILTYSTLKNYKTTKPQNHKTKKLTFFYLCARTHRLFESNYG